MPLILLAGGSIIAWESLFGGQDDTQSLFSWSNILKIAAVGGAAYFAARALKAI